MAENIDIPLVNITDDGRAKDPALLDRFIRSVRRRFQTMGSGSPLTTKGDIFTYDTDDQRLPVGTDGQMLSADSAEATGLKWRTAFAPLGFGPFTPPLADFTTWDNQSSATIDTSTGLAYLTCPFPALAGDNWNSRLKSTGSQVFTMTLVFNIGASVNNPPFAGAITVRDSSTDRRKVFGVRTDSVVAQPDRVFAFNFQNATTVSGAAVLNNAIINWNMTFPIMMRIRVTNTGGTGGLGQWFYEHSIDFQHWIVDMVEDVSGNYVATPDQAGFAIDAFNTEPIVTGLASGAIVIFHAAVT